ncbi:MAG: TIM barrel protein, partial [Candidatus Hydrogenedentes bacterium]|nr:TIM barrel protein [Candidatus Hydrogenedentota bacterium]
MGEVKGQYRFSFGPWNIDEGSDPFGGPVRKPVAFSEKLKLYKKLGFDGVQFHDDDAVPDLDGKSASQIESECKELKGILDGEGLEAEFVAPRLWFAPETIDGAYTSNNADHRRYAIDRSKKAIDIANFLGTNRIVLWLAREGTYIREAKNAREAVLQIRDALNEMLAYDGKVKLLIEPKPNEPVDSGLIPTIGHALGLSYITSDPSRVGGLIESAHSILAGLDPSDDMGYALAHGKLWSVHLNDQGGLKFDQDKAFGSFNLRRAFNQVRVL